MGATSKEQTKWLAVAILAVVFISIVAVQVEPNSSQVTPRIDAIDAGFTQAVPRIEAICISGSGKSSIWVRGKFAREGDVVDGFRILNIYPNRVEFEKYGRTVTGVFPPPRRPGRPESNNSLRQQLSYRDSGNYQTQRSRSTYSSPRVGENGSYYGQISQNTGRPKTVYVRGYYRKDGTYVRSHYRSPPRK